MADPLQLLLARQPKGPELALKQHLYRVAGDPFIEGITVTPGAELIKRGEGLGPRNKEELIPRVHPRYPLADQPRFNDEEIPNTIEKLLREHGGLPKEQVSFPITRSSHDATAEGLTDQLMGVPEKMVETQIETWLNRLTPSVRASILSKGFPLLTLVAMMHQSQEQ